MMKGLFLILCAFLFTVYGKGRCGCSCPYNPQAPEYVGISSTAVDTEIECRTPNNMTICNGLCRLGGVSKTYSGNFGIFDGQWEIIRSQDFGCDGCCLKNSINITDRMLNPGFWVYGGSARYINNGCGSGDTISLYVSGVQGGQPMFEFNNKFTINYDESIGRMTIVFRGSSPKTQQAYCKSGACLNNTNIDTSGITSDASTSNYGIVIAFIVVSIFFFAQ